MSQTNLLSSIGAALAGIIALQAGFSRRKSIATWALAAGMAVLGVEMVLGARAATETAPQDIAFWLNWRWSCMALLPILWLCFAMTYARADSKKLLSQWRLALAGVFLLPVGTVIVCGQRLVEFRPITGTDGRWLLSLTTAGKVLNFLFLPSAILVLSNLEQTFRASVGTMRWRVKFMVIGAGIIFVGRAYTSSQILLYGASIEPSVTVIDSCGLILGGLLMLRSLFRDPFNVAVFVSNAPHESFSLLIAGVYLIGEGILANIVVWLGAATGFSEGFLAISGLLLTLAFLMLSERARFYVRRFVSRSFGRPLYDYRTVWRNFTQGIASRLTEDELCKAAVKLTAEVFQVLSVTVWLVEDKQENLVFAASTSLSNDLARRLQPNSEDSACVIGALRDSNAPADIEKSAERWAEVLRNCQPSEFESGGRRICVPMIAGGELLGVMLLADRVGGVSFSMQDFDLLKCVADQVAAGLLNTRLSKKLLQAKELEAFQTMSAFFVHDLKNTANALNLMIKNLPVHFENPEFRQDALRGITKFGQHLNQLIGRLSALRHDMQIRPVESDLNTIVDATLSCWVPPSGVSLAKELGAVPRLPLDQGQFQKVITNLLLNAAEAISGKGEIRLQTNQNQNWAVLTVADNGCGMDGDFVARSLFRPFQTTKKNGFGIGMFQSRMIVEAHGGQITVQSQLGKGTTFQVLLPIRSRQ